MLCGRAEAGHGSLRRAGAEQGQSSLAALPGLLLRAGLHFTGLHFKGLRLQGVANSRGCTCTVRVGLVPRCPVGSARGRVPPGAHARAALHRGFRCAAQQLVTESGRACIYCTNLAVPVALPVFLFLEM